MTDNKQTIITYNAHPDLAKVIPYEDIHKSHKEYAENSTPFYAPLSVQFSQKSTQSSYSATRLCMYQVLQQFGSYLGFCNFLASVLLGAYQKHQLEKSQIKKLYSANPDKPHEDVALSMFKEDKDQRMKKAIMERETFSYPYWRVFCLSKFGSRWCLCCRIKKKRDDFLQEDALQKLNQEIDIL